MPVRVAIVGLGHIGTRHLRIVQQLPDVELIAIAEPKAQRIDAELSALAFSSPEALFAASLRPDLTVVCTPNGLHTQHCQLALQNGSNVLCEKPLGISTASCLQLLETAEQAQRSLYVVMQNRFSPPVLLLKDLLDSGKLGRVLYVSVNCFWNRDERYYTPGSWRGTAELDGGVLFTQFSHFVDILYWLFGPITPTQGQMANLTHSNTIDFPDTGQVGFLLPQGGMGSLQFSVSCFDKNMESSLTVVGSKGSIRIGGQYMNQLDYCHIADYTPPPIVPTNPPNQYPGFEGSAGNHAGVWQEVLLALRGRPAHVTKGEDGLAVVQLIEQMYACCKQIELA